MTMADESGMKHFDRQFVARQLKKLLRCPICRSDYALKSTNGEENHRPFLLACGHNQCENCLVDSFESGQNLQCAVCSEPALPTIKAEDLTNSSGLPYQLDYHVMGELAELENIRRSSTDHLRQVVVTNNAATTRSVDVSVPVMKSKCCECISSVATRECKQCSALYCRGCFEAVHRNSRVLKAHAFKSLKEGVVDNRMRMRVGNDVFLMPFQANCKIHLTAYNTYCCLCNMTVCGKCVDRLHPGHQVQQLSDYNLRCLPEIPACKSSLDSALFKIHNGQAVVRSANAKQSGYAAEVLASITQRFGQLHGLLQMSELKLTEQLRESSMPGQMELKKAMDQLNGYEAVIKKLQQMLENDSRPGSGAVPENFSLEELLRLTYEHLEKIPSSVKVSKVEGNPYRLASGCRELSQMIEKHFECDYNDPRIVVRFRTDIERNSSSVSSGNGENSFCQSSSSGKEHKYQQQAVIHPRMRSERTDQKQHPNSQSQSQKIRPRMDYRVGQSQDNNELERTFSAMDISTGQCEAKGNPTRPSDWFKSNALVSVLAIKSPEDFYVQGIEAAQQLRSELYSYVLTPSSTPMPIVVGQHYIAYHKDENRFHRVLVSQKLTEIPDTYDVFLPDIGINLNVHSSDFYELPYRLSLFPYAAVHCSLSDLKPRHSMWDAQANTHFKMVLNNNPVHVIVKRPLTHQHYEVDLITTNYKAEISVREAFLYAGLARTRAGTATDLEPLPAPKIQRIPKAKHEIGDVLMIQMLHVNHPQEFYVMRHDFEGMRSDLEDSLKSTMERMELTNLENIFVGRPQMGCVMQWEHRWLRVCIEMLLKDGYVMVRLVDFGSTQKVSWEQLFTLPPQFMQRELSIKCCLADVETLQENDYLWTPEAMASFRHLTSNPKMHMEVISVHEDVHRVTLDVIRPSSETLSVGVQMVAFGHCASTGECSQQADVAPANIMPLDADTRQFIELQKQKDSVLSSPLQRDKQIKNPVELLHVRHPDEFYVTLPIFKAAIQKLQEDVQAAAADRYQNNPIKFDWKEGDMCYVKVRAQGDLTALWHRGVVMHVTQPTTENSLPCYEVQLRDLGELVRDVENVSLASVTEEHQHTAGSAQRCQLYGLRPKNEQWTADNIDFFKDQLQAYDQVYTVSHGRHGQTMSVVLYGSHTVSHGPFTPSRTKYVNINETLLLARVAEKDPEEDYQNDKDPTIDDEADESLIDQNRIEIEYLKDVGVYSKLTNIKPPFEHCEGMPPMKYLMDLGISSPTTGQVMPPSGWLTPRPCKKSLYTGIVTNVNYDCDLYMSLATDKPFMEHMRDLLGKHFKPIKERRGRGPTTSTYAVGQPVLVTYHLDNELYRGIVQGPKNANGEYSVFYVDYGNIEMARADELLPYAPFPQLNALCWLVTIHGVRPKRGKYTIKEMDTVHKNLVMKVSSVNVKEQCGPKKIASCQIKVNSVDIATMMLHSGMAVPVDTLANETSISIPKPTLNEFKVFDELETFAAGGPMKTAKARPEQWVHNETNSTAKSPPVKKKYNVKHTNVQGFEFDQNIDCRQAADEFQPISSGTHFDQIADENGDGMNMNMNLASPQCADRSFSMEFENADIDEGIVNEDDIDENENDNDDKERSTEVKPDFGVCQEQLARRIELHYKEMKDNASFAPLDTSTVRSLYGGKGSFKSHILPAGVKEFQCSIDCLISATELQISPSLREFTKRDVSLVQETSVLINRAAPLHPMLDVLCLARYSKDEQWYRATIKEIHKHTKEATVYYVDFHDTEKVSYAHLKVMPEELFMFPLRSCRVKLHGVKRNPKFGDKTVYQALQACLCNYPVVFARVYYPSNYHASKGDRFEAAFDSSSESIQDGHKLIEVELFEDMHATKRLYEPLIENWMFLKK